MDKKLIRSENPYDGLETFLWQVDGGYSVTVIADSMEETRQFDGGGVVFSTLQEAEEMLELVPYLAGNAVDMTLWLSRYEDKEELPNVYDSESYEEVVQHILSRHGDEGREVLSDPSQAPAMWHEHRHSSLEFEVILDHAHVGTNPAETAQRWAKVRKAIENPLFEELMKLESTQEDMASTRSQLQEIYSRNGIEFDE